MKYKEFRLKKSHCDKHKKLYTFFLAITFFMFFPFVLLQLLEELLEKIINFIAPLRMKMVELLMYLVIRREKQNEKIQL